MFGKAAVLLACLTLARAGTTGFFSPASIGTTSSLKSVQNPKAKATPAPIYETEDTDREIAVSRANEHGLFTPFEKATISETYESRITNNGSPYSPAIGKPISYYPTHGSVVPDLEPGPVTYTTHTHSSPLVDGYPLNIKTVPFGYNSQTPIVQNIGSKVVYDAPSVSYVSVNGPATYSW